MKPPEEGEIWEWRAFGRIPPDLVKKIRKSPLRRDIFGRKLADLRGQDLYLISPSSDQNIKLRRAGDGWFLKYKLLLTTEAHAIELYLESEKMTFRFPLRRSTVEETANLLQVTLPEIETNGAGLDHDAFIRILATSTPPVSQVEVDKIRSQYQMEKGWIELAKATFPSRQTESISLHSFERGAVEVMLANLKIESYVSAAFVVMNYVEACRRWA